jgi:hypothetical protein
MAAVHVAVAEAGADTDGSSDGDHPDKAADETAGHQRLALWAVELQLRHPVTGQQLQILLPNQAELARTCPELMFVADGTS